MSLTEKRIALVVALIEHTVADRRREDRFKPPGFLPAKAVRAAGGLSVLSPGLLEAEALVGADGWCRGNVNGLTDLGVVVGEL